MNRWKQSFWILFCLIPFSCSAIYSTEPVGEKPCSISRQDWDGIWANKGTFFHVWVIDESNGLLRWTWIEPGGKLKVESYEVQLRQSGQWVFGNVKADEEKGLWVWGLVKREGNGLICWIPDAEKFKSLCRRGLLACTEKDGNIVLASITPEHMEIINSEREGVLYDWRDPFVFIRTAMHER